MKQLHSRRRGRPSERGRRGRREGYRGARDGARGGATGDDAEGDATDAHEGCFLGTHSRMLQMTANKSFEIS